MRSSKQKHGKEARDALYLGVKAVYDAVAPTLGARGRNAVYYQYGTPIVTNDGVSIARQVMPKDGFERLGADMIKQAAERTNDEAGDGTSTTVILTKEIAEAGIAAIENGANPMILRREIEDAKVEVLSALKDMATPVDKLLDVAKISVENDTIAELVSGVVERVGPLGSILVEEGHLFTTEVEEVRGYWFERGYVSPYMITNEKGEAVLDDCAVILTDRSLNLNKDLFKVLTDIVAKGTKSVLVIGDKIEGELLQTMIANKMKGTLTTVAVTRPPSVEELEDIAVLTGATAVTKDKGIKDISVEHIGHSPKVIVKKDSTIIVGHDSVFVTDRIESLKKTIDDNKEKYGEIERMKERLARLTGGLAVIRVGAKTEAERGYLKLKIDDAVGACRSAVEEGVVAGGGTVLRDISVSLSKSDEVEGRSILLNALVRPFEKLMQNAGIEEYRMSKNYNVLTGEIVEDMKKVGIVDPAKVARCAIENAVSTATIMLTTETAFADVPELENSVNSIKQILS